MAPPSQLDWRSGYCKATEFSSRESNCHSDSMGAWHVPSTGNVTDGRRRCAARCSRCHNCRFVSFSLENRDCSWYAACNLSRLHPPPREGPDYQTCPVLR